MVLSKGTCHNSKSLVSCQASYVFLFCFILMLLAIGDNAASKVKLLRKELEKTQRCLSV